MSRKAFDQKIDQIQAIRGTDRAQAAVQLKKALRDRNNFLVSKAAIVAAELELRDLVGDLTAAFDRFMENPIKTDPQCWAKIEIARALRRLDHRETATFLRGVRHKQLEPTYGGSQDSAGQLRGICALGLLGCPIADADLFPILTDLLVDPELPARVDAVRAVAQAGRSESVWLLRLKALCGDRDWEVIGECLVALLDLQPKESVEFVERFLYQDEDGSMEAASALAQSRELEAFEALKRFWKGRIISDTRRSVLSFLAGSPVPESAEFLFETMQNESGPLAETALESLSRSRFRSEMHDRVESALKAKGDGKLMELWWRLG